MSKSEVVRGEDTVFGRQYVSLTDHEAARAADKARIAELEAERAELIRDKAKLDFLDRMNAALNQRYGTSYKWKLILSPNVTRLMSGRQMSGHVGDIDLNDAEAFGTESCRDAIDAALAQQGEEGET